MNSRFRNTAVLLFLIFLSSSHLAPASVTQIQEKRASIKKAFLLRTVDDLAQTLIFAEETVELLQKQNEEIVLPVTDVGDNERLSLLELYEKHVLWLRWMTGEFDREVESYFSRQQTTASWVGRHEHLVNVFRERGDEIEARIAQLEIEMKEIEDRIERLDIAVRERRLLVNLADLELARKLWPTLNHRDFNSREAIYKELNETEVIQLRRESEILAERQRYFATVAKSERLELDWFIIKADEFARTLAFAKAFDNDDGKLFQVALEELIGTYAAGTKMLGHAIVMIDKTIETETSLPTFIWLDGEQYLTLHLTQLKDRCERHFNWLEVQIVSYQIDLNELVKN